MTMHNSDSKIYGASMGPTWGRQDPGGPHVGPMNLIIWEMTYPVLSVFINTCMYDINKGTEHWTKFHDI